MAFADRKALDRIFQKTSRGDWFVLKNLVHQIDFVLVANMLRDMDRRMHCDDGATRINLLDAGDSKAHYDTRVPGVHVI